MKAKNQTGRERRTAQLKEKIKKEYQKQITKGKKKLEAKKIAASKTGVSLVWVYKSLKQP